MTTYIKKYKNLILLGIVFVLFSASYYWFIEQPAYIRFTGWAQSNTILLISVLIIIKTLGIIWPPIPGSILTIGSTGIIGWELAFLTEFAGNMLGDLAAYYIGKHYGRAILTKLFDEKVVQQVDRIKIKPENAIEGLFILRIFTYVVAEVVSYVAGILEIPLKSFVIAMALSVIATAPFYFISEQILTGNNLLISVSIFALAGLLFYKLKDRYYKFE